jgi:Zn-dependent peptidase ImmA (M78 family)
VTLLRRGFKTWCEQAALGYRRDLNLKPNSPLDPRLLAQHLGIAIWTPDQIPGLELRFVEHLLRTDPDCWSAVTLFEGAKTVILNNSAHGAARQNSTLAHELSHIVLEHPPSQVFFAPDGQMMMRHYNLVHEEEAGCLSGTLLVPREALLGLVRQRKNEQEIATYFGVSPDLVRMRKNVTGVMRQVLSRRVG